MLRVAVLLLALSATAEAQCPAMDGASSELAERTPSERVAFLLERTRSVEEAGRIWSATFAMGYLGLAAAQIAVLTASTDQGRRADMAIGAVSSLLGVASIVVLPMQVIVDRPEMEELAPRAAAGDCDALARAERIFASDAGSEDFGTSWLMHVGSMLFNIGIGLVQGLGYGRWESGAISAAIGIAVGELQLLTKPTGHVAALVRDRTGRFDAPSLTLAPSVGPSFSGLALRADFM
jgi:hypothetical protein